jgi:Domain of unknown function (DUF1744)
MQLVLHCRLSVQLSAPQQVQLRINTANTQGATTAGVVRPNVTCIMLQLMGFMQAQVLRRGAYRSVCVELEVHHLAVAAVTSLEVLSAMESGDGGGAGPPALRVLQRLVDGWLQEAVKHNNP